MIPRYQMMRKYIKYQRRLYRIQNIKDIIKEKNLPPDIYRKKKAKLKALKKKAHNYSVDYARHVRRFAPRKIYTLKGPKSVRQNHREYIKPHIAQKGRYAHSLVQRQKHNLIKLLEKRGVKFDWSHAYNTNSSYYTINKGKKSLYIRVSDHSKGLTTGRFDYDYGCLLYTSPSPRD